MKAVRITSLALFVLCPSLAFAQQQTRQVTSRVFASDTGRTAVALSASLAAPTVADTVFDYVDQKHCRQV
jgi:hypothetical protein